MGGFASALSTSDAQSLLERFAPYVWLYSEEPFFPCPVDWFLARVQLGFANEGTVGYNTSIITSTVTAANLNTTTNDGQSSGGALSGATVPADNFFRPPGHGRRGQRHLHGLATVQQRRQCLPQRSGAAGLRRSDRSTRLHRYDGCRL